MAASKTRRSKKESAKPIPPTIQGAVPYKPKMSKSAVLAAIKKASGTPTELGAVRARLPGARARRRPEGADRSRGGRERGRERLASPAVPALTADERTVLIDQAVALLRNSTCISCSNARFMPTIRFSVCSCFACTSRRSTNGNSSRSCSTSFSPPRPAHELPPGHPQRAVLCVPAVPD
jgi:hypothetical protein